MGVKWTSYDIELCALGVGLAGMIGCVAASRRLIVSKKWWVMLMSQDNWEKVAARSNLDPDLTLI